MGSFFIGFFSSSLLSVFIGIVAIFKDAFKSGFVLVTS